MERKNGGTITLIIGPMFSGKTSDMFRRIRKHDYAGKKIKIYKYSNDRRYTRKALACSHDGVKLTAEPVSSLKNLQLDPCIQVIGIDEGQFMDGLVEFCDHWANQGKDIIVSALDSDFKREPFENIIQLVSKAEYVHKLHAVCIVCKNAEASFSRRTIDDTVQGQEDIGGAEKYIPTCRTCFNAEIDPKKLREYCKKVNN